MAELEGFICPLCKQDLGTLLQLEAHFSEEHEETTRSKLKTNIKTFFDKARTLGKKKHPEHGVDEGAAAVSSRADGGAVVEPVTDVSGIDVDYWPPQEFGYVTDYIVEFTRLRDAKVSRTVVETNRLVIRLEKLFRLLKEDNPRTSKAVKAVEKNVVPWKPDDEEKRCMKCGKSFGVRRRRHHCRLCGDVICKQCSQYISLSEAYVLLSDCPDYHSLAPSPSLMRKKLRPLKKNKKKATEDDEDDEDSNGIRMCTACEKLIQRRFVHLQSQEKSLVSALYEKMFLTTSEADRLKPSFLEMTESLLSGEHCYTLQATSQKRRELIRLYELIDSISKDILSMGAVASAETSERSLKLCRGIRMYASSYLQDNLLTLPKLPTAENLRRIREQKEREALERIKELERQRELQRQQEAAQLQLGAGVAWSSKGDEGEEVFDSGSINIDAQDSPMKVVTRPGAGSEKRRFEKLLDFKRVVNFKKSGEGGSAGIPIPKFKRGNSGSGWMCDSMATGSVDSQEDPFELQKQQLLVYIRQARKAKRMDEVEALEASLRDIEIAMRDRQLSSLSYGF